MAKNSIFKKAAIGAAIGAVVGFIFNKVKGSSDEEVVETEDVEIEEAEVEELTEE